MIELPKKKRKHPISSSSEPSRKDKKLKCHISHRTETSACSTLKILYSRLSQVKCCGTKAKSPSTPSSSMSAPITRRASLSHWPERDAWWFPPSKCRWRKSNKLIGRNARQRKRSEDGLFKKPLTRWDWCDCAINFTKMLPLLDCNTHVHIRIRWILTCYTSHVTHRTNTFILESQKSHNQTFTNTLIFTHGFRDTAWISILKKQNTIWFLIGPITHSMEAD